MLLCVNVFNSQAGFLIMNTKWTIQTLVASQAKFKIVINSNIGVIIIQLAIYTCQTEGILGRCTKSSSAI